MSHKVLSFAMSVLVVLLMTVNPPRAGAANVMNYGADGNDYFQFTTPSMAFDKASGFTTLITFAMHVNADGTLMIGGVACSNGVYVGPTNWGSLVATLKTPPTTVTRYEVCIGGWQDTSFANIESLVNSQGTGSGSILYKNFQALKNAVPGIDAINDDDEGTYNVSTSTSFANMLGGLGYKFTLVPYQNQSFWVNLRNSITNCDYIYLQCYEGGAGNQPAQWNTAFGHGVVVLPGQESNTATEANWRSWYLGTGAQGGFYYPDVVFNNTGWSAAIIEGNGAVPGAPAAVTVVPGAGQVSLSWNTVPGATAYNVKRATISGGETNLINISASDTWPASNEYIDTGLAPGTTYYYELSAVNTNGESLDSVELIATPSASSVGDFGFETPNIGPGNYAYDPSGAAWTFMGSPGDGSGILANGSAFSNPNAPEGVQAAFVQENGTMTQTISGFVPGTNYTINFLAAERPGNTQSWNVTINGTIVGSYNPGPSATTYAPYSASFTATAAAETLAFVGTDLAGGDNTIFIDDVQIAGLANTVPATAVDVVGGQVSFTAAFSVAGPIAYQWQKISGGKTNNIFGATNTTLTLANLQLTNTASYQLQASNANGAVASTPASLTVNNVPAAVNNIVTEYAAQTGIGSGTFVPTWAVTTNNSLIAGQPPSSTTGNFSLEAPGRSVNSLTAGGNNGLWKIIGTSGATTSTNYVTCGNSGGAGSMIVYTLTGSASGYDLTNITVYGGWADAGRDEQAYMVYYSTEAGPTAFSLLDTVNFTPVNSAGAQCATRATLTPAAGVLATHVAAVKFVFSSPTTPNGYCGYSEINLSGVPSAQPVRWAVGNGSWDTTTLNWKLLSGGSAVIFVENNLAAFDDSPAGATPVTVTLTGNHSPSVLTNNSTKNYVLAGNYALTGGNLIKSGSSTLTLDNGGANGFTNVLINSGTVQVGNNDTNGSLGTGNIADNGALTFDRTDSVTVTNLVSGTGSLAQNGNGTVALSAVNTYAGNTTIGAGTLALAGSGSIGASAQIAVASGATLDASGRADQTLTLNSGQTLTGGGSVTGMLNTLAGSTLNLGTPMGTMQVQGNITLSGTVLMELDRTNVPTGDELTSLAGTITGGGTLTVANVGPTLQPGDTFQLFNQPVSGFGTVNLPPVGANGWANNLAYNGTVTVVSTAAPPLAAVTVGGNVLTLSWPADHTGWRLQTQTDDLTKGLDTNWVDVAGATTTNQISVLVNPANGGVFYRLTYP